MTNHGRMTGDADIAIPGSRVLSGDEFRYGVADANALKVGQHDDAMLATEIINDVVWLQDDGDEGNGNIIPCGEVAFGGGVEIGTQIVMAPK